MEKNFYKILGVSKDASDKDIKQVYRKLIFKYHPDTNGGDKQSEEMSKKINEAYDTLGDTQKRRQYDMESSNPIFGDSCPNMAGMHGIPGMQGIPGGIPSELFNLFAGGLFDGPPPQVFHMNGRGPVRVHQMPSRPPPIEKEIEITLEEAYTGKTKQMSITRTILTGSSRNLEKETIYITIPKGIDTNEIITIKDKGNILNNDVKGDIKVIIKVKNFSKFLRHGIDLIYDKEITLKEALCGFSFDMSYIDGRSFNINNEPGNIISAGYEKVVPGMGMKREHNTGDLIIKFNIVFPKTLDEKQIDSIRKIL